MECERAKGFFVKLPMDETLRAMKEVGDAFPLLWWFSGRVTRELSEASGGIRVGAVLGGVPNTDRAIAHDLKRAGFDCSEDQVYRWRRKLARKGFIAVLRTPAGSRVYVMRSNKFPDAKPDPVPDWLMEHVSAATAALEQTAPRAEQTAPTAEHSALAAEHSALAAEQTAPTAESIKKKNRILKGNGKGDGMQTASATLAFDRPTLRITVPQDAAFRAAFPHVEIEAEYLKMCAWLIAHHERPKNNHAAFAHGWLKRIPAPPVRRPGWDTELDFPLAVPPF